jgi:excisionase family DNA binding protein
MNQDNSVSSLLTVQEVARRLDISKRTLEREIARGRFPRPIKIGSALRVLPGDVKVYLDDLLVKVGRDPFLRKSGNDCYANLADQEMMGLIHRAENSRPSPQ